MKTGRNGETLGQFATMAAAQLHSEGGFPTACLALFDGASVLVISSRRKGHIVHDAVEEADM